MNVQILPNWCKKVGVILFLLLYLIGGIEPFLEGARDNFKKEHFTIEKRQSKVAYENGKQTLRLQSFHIAAIICLILSLLLSYFDTDSRVYIEDIAFIYIILYLIIFKIKKDRVDLIE